MSTITLEAKRLREARQAANVKVETPAEGGKPQMRADRQLILKHFSIMKFIKIYTVIISSLTLASCSVSDYTYRAVKQRQSPKIYPPAGMVYIPAGSVMMGQSNIDEQDSSSIKKVSLSAFFMDKTEVSNAQYRQFINWVRDSIAITNYLKDKSYFQHTHGKDNPSEKRINWAAIGGSQTFWKSTNSKIREKLKPMFASTNKLDYSLLNYEYEIVTTDPSDKTGRKKILKKEVINVWPDEAVWAKDFPNSQNEVMVTSYFTNPLFDDYPVVGVSWKQARAFASWRSKISNKYTNKFINPNIITLPMDLLTEAQWAYVASVTDDIPNKKAKGNGTLSVNYKQGEGTYSEDGYTYTNPVLAYNPNNYGLYNLAGNVSEWTLNAYTENATAFIHDLNPVLLYDARDNDPEIKKRKVVKGGSWKDPEILINPTTRNSEFQDVAKSYIGFRCVMPAPDIMEVQHPKKSLKSKTKLSNLAAK